MKRTTSDQSSALGRRTTLRLATGAAKAFFEHMRNDPHREQMAFGLATHASTGDGTMFLVKEFVVPDSNDLADQTVASVCPTPAYQAYVYHLAEQSRRSLVEFHSHPGSEVPTFSGIDEANAHPNGKYIAERLPAPVTLVMLVGNNRFDAFDGVVYDRYQQQFRQLDQFEVLGRPSTLWPLKREDGDGLPTRADAFDRQRRIPGWNQQGLEQQRIAIFGAGGNGAVLFQTLVAIGAGRRGFIAIADHDLIEPSNLARIPYATDKQVGTPKVAAAVRYAASKSPGTPVYAFPCRFSERPVLDRMKTATVLFYAGDTDGGRKEANDFAVRYGIPLIDLGCDIQLSDKEVLAGGQVRLVLPGQNACLVCCRGFDPAQAALDQMSPLARATQAAAGYVRGADAAATPSVANLNGLTVHHALSQFLAIVNGESFSQWDYLHFDQFSGRTIPARTTRHQQCPLCGPAGHLLEGDALPSRGAKPTTITKFEAKPAGPSQPPSPNFVTGTSASPLLEDHQAP